MDQGFESYLGDGKACEGVRTRRRATPLVGRMHIVVYSQIYGRH